MADSTRPGLAALRWAIGLSVLSTTVHYSHNFVMAEHYPALFLFPTPLAYQIGIAVFWPLLTAGAVIAYRRYRDGETRVPLLLLAAYSLLGISTPGHFLGGNPDIPPFFYVTIFTDLLTGAGVLAWVMWTVRRQEPAEQKRVAT